MEIRELKIEDAQSFSNLIVDMYMHLEDLEWFSPMPNKKEDVENILQNPRFYILGAFDNDHLCGVGSLDFKCGKLIGKIDLPEECDTTKLVEAGFTMVEYKYRGNGIMKLMLKKLLDVAKNKGYEWIFGKVNVNNFASSKSMEHCGFKRYSYFDKPTKIADIEKLLNESFINKIGKSKMENRLKDIQPGDEFMYNDYQIMLREI